MTTSKICFFQDMGVQDGDFIFHVLCNAVEYFGLQAGGCHLLEYANRVWILFVLLTSDFCNFDDDEVQHWHSESFCSVQSQSEVARSSSTTALPIRIRRYHLAAWWSKSDTQPWRLKCFSSVHTTPITLLMAHLVRFAVSILDIFHCLFSSEALRSLSVRPRPRRKS